MVKILVVVSSKKPVEGVDKGYGGWYLPELLHPWTEFTSAGASFDLASTKGGVTYVDPSSVTTEGEVGTAFLANEENRQRFETTLALGDCKTEDYDGIFFVGGFACMWDYTSEDCVPRAIESFVAANKPVAAVCHGPICFLNARGPAGSPIIKGKEVTGFCNAEEQIVGHRDILSVHDTGNTCEDCMSALGGLYSHGPVWGEYALRDGLIITGQNPASASKAAKLLLAACVSPTL